MVASLFMMISAINFGLHFVVFSKRDLRIYSLDSETKVLSLDGNSRDLYYLHNANNQRNTATK